MLFNHLRIVNANFAVDENVQSEVLHNAKVHGNHRAHAAPLLQFLGLRDNPYAFHGRQNEVLVVNTLF